MSDVKKKNRRKSTERTNDKISQNYDTNSLKITKMPKENEFEDGLESGGRKRRQSLFGSVTKRKKNRSSVTGGGLFDQSQNESSARNGSSQKIKSAKRDKSFRKSVSGLRTSFGKKKNKNGEDDVSRTEESSESSSHRKRKPNTKSKKRRHSVLKMKDLWQGDLDFPISNWLEYEEFLEFVPDFQDSAFLIQIDKSIEQDQMQWMFSARDFEERLHDAKQLFPHLSLMLDFRQNIHFNSVSQNETYMDILWNDEILMKTCFKLFRTDYLLYNLNENSIWNSRYSQKERMTYYITNYFHLEPVRIQDDDKSKSARVLELKKSVKDPIAMDENFIGSLQKKKFQFHSDFSFFTANEFSVSTEAIRSPIADKPLSKHYFNEILLKFIDIKYYSNVREPLFLELTLHDIGTMTKISESFYIKYLNESLELNDECFMNFLLSFLPSTNIYLVCRVFRLFGIDMENTNKAYMKNSENAEEKHMASVLKTMQSNMNTLQLMGWGYFPLYEDNALFLELGTIPIFKVPTKSFTDEDIYAILNQKDEKLLGKELGFELEIQLTPFSSKMKCKTLYNESLELQNQNIDDLDPVIIVKESTIRVHDLITAEVVLHPNARLINNLYINPIDMNMKFSSVAKNILITVYFMKNDNSVDYETLSKKVFYPKDGSKELVSSIKCSVKPKTKTDFMTDEIKVKLPFPLRKKNHLLFIFTNMEKKKLGDVNTIIGYGYLKIFQRGIIVDGVHEIVYMDTLEKNYLKFTEESYVLSIKTKANSSVYPQGRILHEFLHSKNFSESTLLIDEETEEKEIIEFFPLILNKILTFFSQESAANQVKLIELFVKILFLLDSFTKTDKNDLNPLFKSYCTFHLDANKDLYTPFISAWEDILHRNSELDFDWRSTPNVVVLFSVITRSMALEIHESPEVERLALPDETKEKFLSLIKIFVRSFSGKNIPSSIVKETGHWFCDLFYLIDRGLVFDFVQEFISNLITDDMFNTFTRKLEFLEVLTDFEFYVPLSLCIPIDIDSPKTVIKNFWRWHYLTGQLLNIVGRIFKSLATINPEIPDKAMNILQKLLHSHTIDVRYKDIEKSRTLIANIYIPFVSICIDSSKALINYPNNSWCKCFLWICENANDNVRQLLTISSEEKLKQFSDLLLEISKRYSTTKHAADVTKLILNRLQYLSIDREVSIWNNENLLSQLILTYEKLLSPNQAPKILETTLFSLLNFIERFSTPFFHKSGGKIFSKIVEKLFSLGSGISSSYVSTCSTSVLFSFFFLSWLSGNRLNLLGLRLSETMYKLSADIGRISYGRIINSMYIYLNASDNYDEDFKTKSLTILSKIQNILILHSKVTTEKDFEEKCHNYYQLSELLSYHIPIRAQLIKTLISLHEQNGFFEESNQCKAILAALIGQYLNQSFSLDLYPNFLKNEFVMISPNVSGEIPIDLSVVKAEYPYPAEFHETGYDNLLQEIATNATKIGLHEIAVEAYKISLHVAKRLHHYEKMDRLCLSINTSSERANDAIQKSTRIFDNYYRVSFFGKKFEKLDGKKYIYKESASLRLPDFCQKLITQFSSAIHKDIELLANKPGEDINEDSHYLQIVSVDPIPNDSIHFKEKTNSVIDKIFHIKYFTFETPFFPEGVTYSEDVDKQWKRRKVYETVKSFPYISRRIEINSEKDIVKGPLECAIDLLHERIEKLEKELYCAQPNPKTLQIVLQGSIMLQVNAGPLAIAQYFLPVANQFPKEHIEGLEAALTEFSRKILFGLKLNSGLIGNEPASRAHQDAMSESYNRFAEELLRLNLTIPIFIG